MLGTDKKHVGLYSIIDLGTGGEGARGAGFA